MKKKSNIKNNTTQEVLENELATSNTQTSLENHHNSKFGEELIKFHQMETIPFMAIVEDNQKPIKEYYGIIGTSKVTESKATKEEVVDAIYSTGVQNYPQLVAIVAGYMELIAQTHFKQLAEERKENN